MEQMSFSGELANRSGGGRSGGRALSEWGGDMTMTRRLISTFLLALSIAHFCVAAPPQYVIGSVPPQQVGQGGVLTFELQSPKIDAATSSYTVTSGYTAPQGAINLNSASGLFPYP